MILPSADLILLFADPPMSFGRRSFGGGYLRSGRLAKIIYVDEAGTDIGVPVTVVAGTIIDPDAEWDAAAARLNELREMLPIEIRDKFILHATELYSGGRTIDRKKYDKNVRFPILEKLFASLRELELPFFFAYEWKATDPQVKDPKLEMFFRHVGTFLRALNTANQVMKTAFPSERATLTVEDTPTMRQYLVQVPRMLRMADAPEKFMAGPHPFDGIVDAPNFTVKQDAPLLVFADAAAFAIRHYLSGHKDGPWAIGHLMGSNNVAGDIEPLFAEGRNNAGGAMAMRFRRRA
jgi:hypothetical protein